MRGASHSRWNGSFGQLLPRDWLYPALRSDLGFQLAPHGSLVRVREDLLAGRAFIASLEWATTNVYAESVSTM